MQLPLPSLGCSLGLYPRPTDQGPHTEFCIIANFAPMTNDKQPGHQKHHYSDKHHGKISLSQNHSRSIIHCLIIASIEDIRLSAVYIHNGVLNQIPLLFERFACWQNTPICLRNILTNSCQILAVLAILVFPSIWCEKIQCNKIDSDFSFRKFDCSTLWLGLDDGFIA